MVVCLSPATPLHFNYQSTDPSPFPTDFWFYFYLITTECLDPWCLVWLHYGKHSKLICWMSKTIKNDEIWIVNDEKGNISDHIFLRDYVTNWLRQVIALSREWTSSLVKIKILVNGDILCSSTSFIQLLTSFLDLNKCFGWKIIVVFLF